MRGLVEGKYTLESRLTLMPDFLQLLFLNFYEKVFSSTEKIAKQERFTPWARTHIRGVTFFCTPHKAFVFCGFQKNHLYLNFYTGSSKIDGLQKTTWLHGGDKKGGYYKLDNERKLDTAVKHSVESYKIAILESSS